MVPMRHDWRMNTSALVCLAEGGSAEWSQWICHELTAHGVHAELWESSLDQLEALTASGMLDVSMLVVVVGLATPEAYLDSARSMFEDSNLRLLIATTSSLRDVPASFLIDLRVSTEAEALTRLLRSVSIDTASNHWVPRAMAESQLTAPASLPSSVIVESWRLPPTAGAPLGREFALEELDLALSSPKINVATVVGWGGSGKSALVNHWLARVAADGYRGAKRVFAWNFGGHRDDERETSSDLFFEAALSWYGVEAGLSLSLWERGQVLAQKIQESTTLLILDGIEALQDPPKESTDSRINDPAFLTLVKELAAHNAGLCILTSRQSVSDIAPFDGLTVKQVELPPLTQAISLDIFERAGVTGTGFAQRTLVEYALGHALTLVLLASYVREVHGGEADSAVRSLNSNPGLVAEDSHAERVMNAYQEWLGDSRETELLRCLCLFNGPATREDLATLWAEPGIELLSLTLSQSETDDIARATTRLVDLDLLLENSTRQLDMHPLVRAHYRSALRRLSPDASRLGHTRLYDEFRARSVPANPRLSDLESAMEAIYHGAQAAQARAAYEDVYLPVLSRGIHFLRDVAGAPRADLEVLNQLLLAREGELPAGYVAAILSDIALDRRVTGDTMGAIDPMRRAAKLSARNKNRTMAASAHRHLAQLMADLASFEEALTEATHAVTWLEPEDSESVEFVAAHASLGFILLQKGEVNRALAAIEATRLTAEKVANANDDARMRSTFHIAVHRSIEVLLNCDRLEDARQMADAAASLEPTRPAMPLVRAISDLSSLAVALQANLETPLEVSRLAVATLRTTGQQPWLVKALISHARCAFNADRDREVTEALDEASTLAARHGMKALEIDAIVCEFETGRFPLNRDGRVQRLQEISDLARAQGYQRVVHYVGQLASPDD